MISSSSLRLILGVAGCAVPLSAISAHAAVLAGTVNETPTTAVNLSSEGTTNWAVWNYGSGTTGATIDPSNTHDSSLTAGTAGFISALSQVGGGTIRGGNASTIQFSYGNGESPTSFGPAVSGMVFPSALDTPNRGVSLTVTGDPSQIYQVSVWASGLAGQGTMTATLAGATTRTLFSQTYTTTASANGAKGATLFTFTFQPDSATDLLNLSYVLTTDTSPTNNSHVGISAVAVSVIPEPSVGISAIAGLGILVFRRRRG